MKMCVHVEREIEYWGEKLDFESPARQVADNGGLIGMRLFEWGQASAAEQYSDYVIQ